MPVQETLPRLRLMVAAGLSIAGAWSVAATSPQSALATGEVRARAVASVRDIESPASKAEVAARMSGDQSLPGVADLQKSLMAPGETVRREEEAGVPALSGAGQTASGPASDRIETPAVETKAQLAAGDETAAPRKDQDGRAEPPAGPESAAADPDAARQPVPESGIEASASATAAPRAETPSAEAPLAEAPKPQSVEADAATPPSAPHAVTAETSRPAGADTVPPTADVAMKSPATECSGGSERAGLRTVLDANPDRYELGNGDRIKITFYERADLNTELRIREDGHIAIPLVGRIKVAGLDSTGLEQAISEAFQIATGRVAFVSVDIVERRPFYVVGFVNKAGVYPYTPGMTVLHAVAISGGIYRPPSGMFSELEVSRESSRARQTVDTLKRALARHARLVAERSSQPLTDLPKRLVELVGREEATILMSAEDRAWQLRASTFHQQLDAHKRAAALAKSELTALSQRLVLDEKKVELARGELGDLRRLEAKGLARRQRLLEAQRLIADLEGSVRDVTAQIARSERTLADSERDAGMLGHDFASKLEQEIRQLEEQIAAGELGLRATQSMIGQLSGNNLDQKGNIGEPQVTYQIIRRTAQGQELIDVGETTQMSPGDVLRVTKRSEG